MYNDTTALDFSDVLIQPNVHNTNISSRKAVQLEVDIYDEVSETTLRGIPIISANMDTVSTMEMASIMNKNSMFSALHKHYEFEHLLSYFKTDDSKRTFYTLGISNSEREKFNSLKESGLNLPLICIDVANGYMHNMRSFIEQIRHENPNAVIMAGNVVCPEGANDLVNAGASIVKVGIGSGSACSTRYITGVGMPQFTAVNDTSSLLKKGIVCSDGGCTSPGDIAKAFAAGAEFVMIGGMLAGHEESGGELIIRSYLTNELDENGMQITSTKYFKRFYGMSSSVANEKYAGGLNDYRASEGWVHEIPFRGKVQNTINEILGGLRSTCTYVGVDKLENLFENATIVKVHRTRNQHFDGFNKGN